MRKARVALGFLLGMSVLPPSAHARSRPTSGDASIVSGRTLGSGEAVFHAHLGFPTLGAGITLAPTSTVNVELSGDFAFASPFMGFGTGVGGQVSALLRVHLFGRGETDLAFTARPRVVVGEARLVGEELIFSDDFGLGIGGEVGLRVGHQLSDVITLAGGLGSELAFTRVGDADESDLIGVFTLMAGVEALLSRSTLLAVTMEAGGGVADGDDFAGHGVFRGWVIVGYWL